MSKETFYAFLSYNTKDGEQVVEIAELLKEQNVKVWLDKWEIRPGDSLHDALEDGLRRSNVILIFFGKYGTGQWQKEEAKIAIRQAITTGKKVIPILLPGCPEQPDIPEFLKDKLRIDFRKGLSNHEERERLLWGITGNKLLKEKKEENETEKEIDLDTKRKIEDIKARYRSPLITLSDALSKNKRSLVLVIGSGINTISNIPTLAELAKPLYEELALDAKGEESTLIDPLSIAELYEQEFGRQRLFEHIASRLSEYTEPSLLHEGIVQLNPRMIFTINYDLLLERAFEKYGINYVVINRDNEYASYQSSDTRCRLIKLYGSMNTPEDIILTRSQTFTYENSHPNFVRSFQEALLTSTVFFIGVDLKEYNLESLYIKTLKNLQDKGPRHYIIIKGTNEKLIRFYENYNLKAIALQNWDELFPFLAILKKEAEEAHTQKDFTNQSGSIILSPPEKLLQGAIRHYQQRYDTLRAKFERGAGETLVADLEKFLGDLEPFQDDVFHTLKCKVYLILAQIPLNRRPLDFKKAAEYLKKAEASKDEKTIEFTHVVRSLVHYYKGEFEEAALELKSIKSDEIALNNAFRIRFLIALEKHNIDQEMVGQAIEKAKTDKTFLHNLALYYSRQKQPDKAEEYLNKFLASPELDALDYTHAAILKNEIALFERKQFCEKYKLLDELNLFFKPDLLINRDHIKEASRLFVKAAEKYKELGEDVSEQEALELALRPLIILDIKSDNYLELIERLRIISPESQYALMETKSGEGLKDYSFDQFKAILEVNARDINYLWLIVDWGRATNKIEDALALFDERQSKMESIKEKIVWTFARIHLFLFAKNREGALQTAEGLIVDAEYGYFALLFQAFVHASDISGYDKAEALIAQAKQKENPEILAFSCEYWKKRQNWQELEKCADSLCKIVLTEQTVGYYLEALGMQRKYLQCIEIIEDAERKHISLPEKISLIAKARTFVNVQREEEALQLYENAIAQNIPLESMDYIIIAQLYIHFSEYKKAEVLLEKQKVNDPSPEVYILLSNIEEQTNPPKAFDILDEGKEKFPDHEALLSRYIMIGFATGHGEQVAPLMTEFTIRFPGSKFLRPYPIDDAIKIIKEGEEHAQYLMEMYRKGENFALGIAHALPNTSLFRFWRASQLNRGGLFISFGEQGQNNEKLFSKYSQQVPVILEYTALLSVWFLWKREWKKELFKLFSSILFPDSFRAVLNMERNRLFQPQQHDRYKTRKKIAEIIAYPSTPFKSLGINDKGEPDEETERHYAEENNCYYLNEYTTGKRYKKEIGFIELAALLRATGRITANKEKELLKTAKQREFIPIEELKQQKCEIVVNLGCLIELVLLDLIEPLLKQFKTFYYSERAFLFIKKDIREYEFNRELKDEFIQLEETIFETDSRIQWFQGAAIPRRDTNDEQPLELNDSVKYVFQIGNYANEKKYLVLSDDRFIKKAIYHPDNFSYIGTDTLLLWLHRSGKIEREVFIEYYSNLVEWNYQPMAPEPEYLLSLLPVAPGADSELFQTALTYYQKSFKEIFALFKQNQTLFKTYGFVFMNTYRQGLADTLMLAWKKEIKTWQIEELVKKLTWAVFIDEFSGKLPEFLTTLWPHTNVFVLPARDETKGAFTKELAKKKEFLTWLREVYIGAGFSGEDVDYALQNYVRHMMDFDLNKADISGIDASSVEKSRKSLLMFILSVLPDETINRIGNSQLGIEITNRFGLPFNEIEQMQILQDGKVVYNFPFKKEDLMIRIMQEFIASGQLKGRLETDNGSFSWESVRRPDNFFLLVNIMPENVDPQYKKQVSIAEAIDLLEMFHHISEKHREKAWEIGLQKIVKIESDPLQWKRLKLFLLSEDEKEWKDAAESCIKQLFSKPAIAVSILEDAIKISHVFFIRILSNVTKEAFIKWFEYDEISFESKAKFLAWAHNSVKLIPAMNELLEKVSFLLCSCFPDAEIHLTRLCDAIVALAETDFKVIIETLIDQSKNHPSPFYKINLVLLLLHIGAKKTGENQQSITEFDFWTGKKSEDKDPLYKKCARLLEDALHLPGSAIQDNAQQEDLKMMIFGLSNFFLLQWQLHEREKETNNENRYFSCIAASFIIGELKKKGLFSSLETKNVIMNGLGRNVPAKELPGFYQPYLAWDLNYPASYLTKAFQNRTTDFEKYFYTNAIQDKLLIAGIRHAMAFHFLGTKEVSDSTWLDDSFNLSPTGGIETFLREIAGSSLKFWTEEQQTYLDMISSLQSLTIQDAAALFINIISNQEQKSIPLVLDFLNLVLLAFAKGNRNGEMYSILLLLLKEEFLQTLKRAGNIYADFLERISHFLQLEAAPAEVKASILAAILPTQPKEDILELHLQLVLGLLHENTEIEAVFAWIETTVFNSDLDFTLRRKIVRFLTDTISQFSPALQLEIDRILSDLAQNREWLAITELDNYRKKK
jgi:hypothetical protein